MINLYDIAYGLAVGAAAPAWAVKRAPRDKVLTALGQRMGHVALREGDQPAILIHAVSLGEMNATRELVAGLQSQIADLHVTVSTTTTTGFTRGRQLYTGRKQVDVVRFPLDFSFAVNRLLDAIDPQLVVLMEGEIWPNFLLICEQRQIPVVLVNGRMTESAFNRYRRIRFITARMLRRIAVICAQDQVYADRFAALGAPKGDLRITGTMKFDTASIADSVPGDQQLAADLKILPGDGPLLVCGSTGPGEETLLLEVYRRLLADHPTLRLAIIPRKPERFDEVAGLIARAGFELLRRSKCLQTPVSEVPRRAGFDGAIPPVILGDTMGELRKFYSLASVVFVGRSLVDLGSRQWGSDMIEPAALAKPVAIGPWTHNFAEAVRSFKAADAMVEVADAAALTATLHRWLSDPESATQIGRRAQAVVRENQGATQKHIDVILGQLHSR
jgi:3-deoxy-D-manno-octulosonic-acid transferase